jgi:hypothetical protein
VAFLEPGGSIIDNLDVTGATHIDSDSKPITGFNEPLITTSVLPDQSIFVSVYHRMQKKQYYFMYSYLESKMTTSVMSREIDEPKCSKLNFPIKSFYSEATGKCTTFYR